MTSIAKHCLQVIESRLQNPGRELYYGRVYFVQCGKDGPIKIGFTTGPMRKRLDGLQTSCPYRLKVLGVIANQPRESEAYIQAAFRKSRTHREWFKPTPELLAFIARYKSPPRVFREIDPPPVPKRRPGRIRLVS